MPSAITAFVGDDVYAQYAQQSPRFKRQAQHSDFAKIMMSSRAAATMPNPPLQNLPTLTDHHDFEIPAPLHDTSHLAPPLTSLLGRALLSPAMGNHAFIDGVGHPLSDTPMGSAPSTASNSPRIHPVRQNSGTMTPRVRPPATTLNIPGMTRSKVSPDGKIAPRDVGAKLVVIMVGLPARGKSYITKKMQRYLSWQQHETRIFNVGNRRRVAAAASLSVEASRSPPQSPQKASRVVRTGSLSGPIDEPTRAASMIMNGIDPAIPIIQETEEEVVVNGEPLSRKGTHSEVIKVEEKSANVEEVHESSRTESIDQSADFFSPTNSKAAALREEVAMQTLEELLDFLLVGGGSVGILDATNSTIERRQTLFSKIKATEPKLGILFVESVCEDEKLLEANMRLKLSGPDYKGKDPQTSYDDFKKRVAAYESAYVPLGAYEEANHMQYIKMIDVGRKVIHYQLQGFLASGIASYLSTFNLSPRQIWITRHGKSVDNHLGKIGGDSVLTDEGRDYATTLYNFITHKRSEWEADQRSRINDSNILPPRPGTHTPPYPDLSGDLDEKNFCVWTSMLQRGIQTAKHFDDDDDYDVKNWEMLNELNAGSFEGLTYEEIASRFPEEYAKRAKNKLTYIYPGVGGEGYLQVISRLRDMVREIERIKDHVLIIGHRSVARVLMAYFMDLTRNDIADLDVPLGMLYVIEPKPYGIDFHAYKYDEQNYWFDELVGYKPQKETKQGN